MKTYSVPLLVFIIIVMVIALPGLWFWRRSLQSDSTMLLLERYLSVYEELHEEIVRSHSWDRVLVIRLPNAGIGNRLTAIASAMVLGMLTRRAVLVDGGLYRMGQVWESLRIQWDYDALSVVDAMPPPLNLGDAEIPPLLCQDLHRLWVDHVGPVILSTGQNFLHHLSSNPHHSHLFKGDGPLSSENLMGLILRRYMQPAPHLMKHVTHIKTQMMGGRERVVGIHLRDIYHTTAHKVLQLECAQLLARHDKRERYFVASDTQGWTRAATERLGPGHVLVNPFIDQGRGDMGDDPQYRGHRKGIEGAIVDLWVLGTACHDLVLTAGSTFSYVAQVLHGAPAVVVSRQGKCVRPLLVDPVSGVFPDLRSQPCWQDSMWDAAKDQLCADPLCPIACGGRHEREQGETTEWLQGVLQEQINARTPQERHLLEEKRVSNERALQRARQEDPLFWKLV